MDHLNYKKAELYDVKLPPKKKSHKFYETANPKRFRWKKKVTTNLRRKEQDEKYASAFNFWNGGEDENVPASKYQYDSSDDYWDSSEDEEDHPPPDTYNQYDIEDYYYPYDSEEDYYYKKMTVRYP